MNLRIDKAELRRVCADLNVYEPAIAIVGASGDKAHGGTTLADYCWGTKTITIYAGTERAGGNLRQTMHNFNNEFLHELRHHWQHIHHPDWFAVKEAYWSSKVEVDARDFAAQKMTMYRVIRVAPRKVSSRLSRLSQAEARYKPV